MGQGLGTRLLARALADAARKGCDTVEISVQPTNVAVWEMYRRYGFQERLGGSDWNCPLVHELSTVRQPVAQKLGDLSVGGFRAGGGGRRPP